MYAYFVKGWTVGHVLTRLVLREITSIPGIILDLALAIFWVPNYTSYWAENSAYIDYADGTRHHGVMRGIFGWIGEFLGFIIGSFVGALIGTALFVPDLLLQGVIFLSRKCESSIEDFVKFICKTPFFGSISDSPKNYSQKSWILGTAIIGMTLAAIPYTLAKIIEFFFPFLPLSKPILSVSAAIGGVLGWFVGVFIYPPVYFFKKCVDLIEIARDTVRDGVALIYAKSGQVPVNPDNQPSDCCIPAEAIHSDEFYDKVEHYQQTSWARLIFGPLKGEASLAPEQASDSSEQLLDPFTLESLGVDGVSTVIDPHGHTFNNYKGTSKQGIHFWLQTHHKCPLNNENLTEADLVPNRAFDELNAKMH
ncbi:hypothetical protein OQJ18_02480 [Fluoribacter dumoffii]|uniref:Uncharacterized protein n=1 Tax=Fluoribacter dumoffii TaxID=463 RepID=A0A377GBY0_9GAMM|nr:hypothetical protein [Fluoribacter dumoffii]KTC88714.1 hypothetical protein Ldum_2972 [Fluoribacter dumoffii NY 23]MCW8385993.1 hypothetical protein [Fluoribacter dumoffii]MCW8419045.1 hypothetical protein [Fluoribacter dumoffii]MCW8453111.1 hypothetical protein [Fluoribacter dumoffii]MCW8459671.1 hypothetical protein [Fluoribacter dumoffii]